jgi:DNA-binding transcriptional ArsR family regulator
MSDHETAGVTLVPQKPKNLPNRILRAVDNAMHVGALPRSLRPTLAEIARYVPQDRPFDTVFAKKESIARRINASVETVFRHLRALKAHGLIETLEQERKSRNGRFAVSRIRLTHKAAALLGFIPRPDDVCTDAVVKDHAALFQSTSTVSSLEPTQPAGENPEDQGAAQSATNAATPVIHTPPHGKMTDGHTLTKPTLSKHQLPQRTENGLPVDLAWLTGNGMSRAGIFYLMGLAKAKQKRLSDIVTVVEQRIRELKGSELFAYLAALCKGPTDFSAAAATERARVRAERLASEFQHKAALFRERFKGIALTNPAQTLLILIDRSCAFAQIFKAGKPPAMTPLHDLKPMIERVESGQLVMATLALERHFAAA